MYPIIAKISPDAPIVGSSYSERNDAAIADVSDIIMAAFVLQYFSMDLNIDM